MLPTPGLPGPPRTVTEGRVTPSAPSKTAPAPRAPLRCIHPSPGWRKHQGISPFLSVDVVILIIKVDFFVFFFFNAHSRGMPLSLAGGLCTTGLQERLVSTMAATISSISTAASSFLHRGGTEM